MDDNLNKQLELNYIEGFFAFQGLEGIDIEDGRKFTTITTNSSVPWLNGVLRTTITDRALIKDAVEPQLQKFKGHHKPFVWHLGVLSSEANILQKQLSYHGGVEFKDIAMVADLKNESLFETDQSELKIKTIETEKVIDDWIVPFSQAFNLDSAGKKIFRHYIARNLRSNSVNIRCFTGYVEDSPVASSMYFVAAKVPVIYNVGTLIEFRRRGFASAMVQATCSALRKSGESLVGLYSSPENSYVYRKLGFQEIGQKHGFSFENNT